MLMFWLCTGALLCVAALTGSVWLVILVCLITISASLGIAFTALRTLRNANSKEDDIDA